MFTWHSLTVSADQEPNYRNSHLLNSESKHRTTQPELAICHWQLNPRSESPFLEPGRRRENLIAPVEDRELRTHM